MVRGYADGGDAGGVCSYKELNSNMFLDFFRLWEFS